MPRSMTGYGMAEAVAEDRRITVEMKAVNNRYLDLNLHLPRRMNALEAEIRAFLKEQIVRGKVDVYISDELPVDTQLSLKVNQALLAAYMEEHKRLAETYGLKPEADALELLRMPEVLQLGEGDVDLAETKTVLFAALKDACAMFTASQAAEGERLVADLLSKLSDLQKAVQIVQEHEPEIVERYRARALEKMEEVLKDSQADTAQLISAAVLYADKISTDEETVRLASHIAQMRELLQAEKSEGIGKNLDFLTQEMNREANTILSKAGDLLTADTGIMMKTTIEKIREQVQNIA